MRACIINHKKYTVEHIFNMVGNYYFTDKDGKEFIVDSSDVWQWNEEEGMNIKDGVEAAIAYAKEIADYSEDGVFWWKEKEAV